VYKVVYASSQEKDFRTMQDIADALGIEYETVKMHIYHRRQGKDPISISERGERVKIYERE
jgi:hypothetical protein